MSEPLRKSYSNEEAIEHAKQWMRETYGIVMDLPQEQRDRYYQRLGLLVDFLHTMFPTTVKTEQIYDRRSQA